MDRAHLISPSTTVTRITQMLAANMQFYILARQKGSTGRNSGPTKKEESPKISKQFSAGAALCRPVYNSAIFYIMFYCHILYFNFCTISYVLDSHFYLCHFLFIHLRYNYWRKSENDVIADDWK